MVVIGIDIGDKFCVVSRESETGYGSIIVLNDRNERKTNSYVSFGGNKREFGIAAKNLHATNIGSTFNNLKRSISEIAGNRKDGKNLIPTALKLDIAPFVFKYKDESEQFNSIQLLAMLLSELKSYAETEINTSRKPWDKLLVTGCNISIPMYFSSYSQKALLLAAGIASLSVHSLVKDTTSVALAYGWRKKFPKTTKVAFVDFGHMAVQICIWKFTNRSFEFLAESFEPIGGRDIDEKIADYFIEKIQHKQLLPNFWVKFQDEIEILKCKMSSDTVTQKLNIGLLINDESSEYLMDRSQMEAICQDLFEKIEDMMKRCLLEAKLDTGEIDSIELIGGSSRLPKFKEIVKAVFGKYPVSTMNREEAVAIGCLLKEDFAKKYPRITLSEPLFAQNIPMRSSNLICIDNIHPHYYEKKKDCLIWSRDDFKKFKEVEKSLKIADQQEEIRHFIRNKLAALIKSEKKVFNNISCRYTKSEQENISRWHDGTIECYQEKLDELSEYVEQEKEHERIEAKEKFQAFIKGIVLSEKSFNQTIRSNLIQLKSWNNGKTEEYEAKLLMLKDIVESEKKRIQAHALLISFINKLRNSLKTNANHSGLLLLRSTLSLIDEIECWYSGSFEEYTKKHEELEITLAEEDLRSETYGELLNFIRTDETMKSIFLSNPEIKSECKDVENWKNGSTEEYKSRLTKYKGIVEGEIQRRKDRHELLAFINIHENSRSLPSIYFNNKYESDTCLAQVYKKGTSSDYETVLRHWQLDISHEKDRTDAREDLLSYIKEEEESNGLLVDILDERMKQYLQEFKASEGENAKFYRDALTTCKNYANQERLRLESCKNLLDYIEETEKSWPNFRFNTVWYKEITTLKHSLREKTVYYVDSLERLKTIVADEVNRLEARKILMDFIKEQEESNGFPQMPSENFAQKLSAAKRSVFGTTQFHESTLKYFRSIVECEKQRRDAFETLISYMDETPNLKNDSMRSELERFRSMSNGSKLECEDALERCKQLDNEINEQQKAYQEVIDFRENATLTCEGNYNLNVFNEILTEKLHKAHVSPNEDTGHYIAVFSEFQSIFKGEELRFKEYIEVSKLFESEECRADAFVEFFKEKMECEHWKIKSWTDGTLEEYQEKKSYWSKAITEETQRIDARQELMTYLQNEVSVLEKKLPPEQRKQLDESYERANENTNYYNNRLQYWKKVVYELKHKAAPATQSNSIFGEKFIKKCRDRSNKIKHDCKNNSTGTDYIIKIESFYSLKSETKPKDQHNKKLEKLLEDSLESLKNWIDVSVFKSLWGEGSKKKEILDNKLKQLIEEVESLTRCQETRH